MKTIQSYSLNHLGINTITTHMGATVLGADIDKGQVVVHLLVDTRNDMLPAIFSVIPQGRPVIDYVKNMGTIHAQSYVDTVRITGDAEVVHVFSLDLQVAK